MKKAALLFFAIIIFTAHCFAKKPEIVNPPKPHAKFKWLLVIKHTGDIIHTHYIFVNDYHIFKESDDYTWLIPEGKFEAFLEETGTILTSPNTTAFVLIRPDAPKSFVFLQSKVPESYVFKEGDDIENAWILFNGHDVKLSWMKDDKEIKLKAKKAKIVFK